MNTVVAVTGKSGQLGWELQQLAAAFEDRYVFIFTDRLQLDLSNPSSIAPFFEQYRPAYFINCAAYTAVDKAESEREAALLVNATAVEQIAIACELHQCKLITISTDYVFDGNGTTPYKTDMETDPVNYYGYSKYLGEQLAQQNNPSCIIVRTSWVYSVHGNNFVKTMLRLMRERTELKVVSDQIGSPTYAADLAAALMLVVEVQEKGNMHSGIYHYSNTGIISWYEFAESIRSFAALNCKLIPITTPEYPTPAKRPAYSVMHTDTFAKDFNIPLKEWEGSLKDCMQLLLK
ncbi:MAG: dTDP-4-dehydrorhamnose reductase [Sphingobacteriia bacterium]|nr:MAG: dTDP-4-dehydrorhamnose reductase [Sphingobacteriia bacterium]TAG31085.1 MAG: dTDP-4-dehydrorhamnose reductase [Sphingobacteriia bacterium]TAH08385.1 MAG: dTDP-4-dehydrorhamnose reductase [Sphingobacteriia bacterium]